MYRVLIADDERLEREALQFVIGQLSDVVSEVVVAANGREAVEHATAAPPDIAIIDIKMPGISGIEAARRIRAMSERTRIVFLTAFSYFDYAQEAIRLHADDFLIKPVDNEQIQTVIRSLAAKLDEAREPAGGGRSYAAPAPAPTDSEDRRSDELAQSKLIGDAVLGLIDQKMLCRYLGISPDAVIKTFAIVLRVDGAAGALGDSGRPGSPASADPAPVETAQTVEHQRLQRRRVVRELERLAARERAYLLSETETGAVYGLLVAPQTSSVKTATEVSDLLQAAVTSVRELFGATVVAAFDGPAEDVNGLGLRFARAKAESKRQTSVAQVAVASGDEGPAENGRREILAAEQRLLRAILSEEESAGAELSGLVQAVRAGGVSPHALAAELADALTYVTHSVAMHMGNLSPAIYDQIRAMGAQSAQQERDVLLEANEIVQRMKADVQHNRRSMHTAVASAIELIESSYQEDLSVEQIAEHVGLSPFHLSRIFKSSTGATIVDYLTQHRIELARERIANTDAPIKEISAACGYSDQNYFSRVFKRITGCSPSEYRRAHR